MKLSDKKCIPCEQGGIDPLSCDEAKKMFGDYESQLIGWKLNDTCTRITTEKMFSDFVAAMKFVNQVANVAESAGHHPDISVSYNRVTLDLWTHSIGGLSENDFIVAAQINELS